MVNNACLLFLNISNHTVALFQKPSTQNVPISECIIMKCIGICFFKWNPINVWPRSACIIGNFSPSPIIFREHASVICGRACGFMASYRVAAQAVAVSECFTPRVRPLTRDGFYGANADMSVGQRPHVAHQPRPSADQHAGISIISVTTDLEWPASWCDIPHIFTRDRSRLRWHEISEHSVRRDNPAVFR